MSLVSMLAPVAEDMADVDALIRRRLDSDVALVRQVAEYLVASGGKRLRPALLLLACGALDNRSQARLPLAVVIEFIHTATLLHDDVVDASELRRGRTTANAAFGNPAAVLVGDFLYSRAFQIMVELDDMRVMQVLAEATNTIAAGEVMQLMGIHDPEVDEARYLEVIRRKTAKLFEAAARLGAVLSRNADAEPRLAEYGRHVGTAFQLVDDVLDYGGDIGKSLGDDLAEGKATLPLIYTMRCGSAEQAALVRKAIAERQQHLLLVFVPELPGIAPEQRPVDPFRERRACSHDQDLRGIRPELRACESREVRRSASAAATRRPNFVNR